MLHVQASQSADGVRSCRSITGADARKHVRGTAVFKAGCASVVVGDELCWSGAKVLEFARESICCKTPSLKSGVCAPGARGAGDDMHFDFLHGRGVRLGKWDCVESEGCAGAGRKPREHLL